MFHVSRAVGQAGSRAAVAAARASKHWATAGRSAMLAHKTPRAVFAPCRRYVSSIPLAGRKSTELRDTELAAEIGLLEMGTDTGKRWARAAEGQALERSFRFKNFTKTWDFMTAVALQCKLKNHHPEWSNVYNTVFIRWTTHAPEQRLTIKDIEMIRICDALGKAFGEQADDAEPAAEAAAAAPKDVGPTCKMQSLADTAKGITGGDCCNHTGR